MKVKYYLSALCLAALAAGCSKDGGTAGASGDLRITVSQSPVTRTALDADGLTVRWEPGDQLYLYSSNSLCCKFSVIESTISSDGSKADFSLAPGNASPAAGTYWLFNYNGGHFGIVSSGGRNNVFFYYEKELTVASANANKCVDGALANLCMAGKVSVPEDATSVTATLKHYSALLELPITLTSNETGGAVTLNSVQIATRDGSSVIPTQFIIDYATGEVKALEGGAASSLKTAFSDTPALTLSTPYKVYMPVPAAEFPAMVITVSTSAGDFTFDKAAKTFEAGRRYTVSGLDIEAKASAPTVSNETEWNQAIAAASGPVTVTLSNDVTLSSSASIPTQAVTVSGPHTLTFDMMGVKSSPVLDAAYDVVIAGSPEEATKGNDKRELPAALTLADGACLVVNNGYLYAKDLVLGNGSRISASKGRLVLSGTLSVAEGASASISSGTIVSCDELDVTGGTLTVGGRLYYGSLSAARAAAPANAVSKASAQLPYSGFDDWFTKSVSAFGFVKGTADLVGISGNTDAQNVWGNGNGNNAGKGGLALSGENPTTKDADNKVGGAYSLKMYSKYVKISITNKFAAGNLFTGNYTGTSGTTGATMDFGTPYTEKPVALTGYYRYNTGKINYINSKSSSDRGDEDDRCDIYVALSKKVYNIDTTKDNTYPGGVATTDLVGDENIVAYGRITSSTDTGSEFKHFRIELTYKNDDFDPADVTHILVVASSSAEGAQFNGSDSAVLWLDELQLEF